MIQVRNVSKTFLGRTSKDADVQALRSATLDIPDNQFFTLIGPSGCGKTTLLRIVAGLTEADAGDVLIDGKKVTGPGPERSVVFQNFALLPWADVQNNVAFGLEMRGVPREERLRRARELLQMVGLEGFERSYPGMLSGGMQQRVGLARALAVDPQVLLMDEPFGSLDEQTRRLLQEQLLQIWQDQRKTVIFVTHSMEEAVYLADQVVLMSPRPGQIKEVIKVPFARPRPPDIDKTKEFQELKAYLWEKLKGMQHSLVASKGAAATPLSSELIQEEIVGGPDV